LVALLARRYQDPRYTTEPRARTWPRFQEKIAPHMRWRTAPEPRAQARTPRSVRSRTSVPAFVWKPCEPPGLNQRHSKSERLTIASTKVGGRIEIVGAGLVVLSEVGMAASTWASPARRLSVTGAVQSPLRSLRGRLPHRPGRTIRSAERNCEDGCSGRCWISPFELGAVDPDAMQDHRHLARDRDARLAVP
jgi:hypothetical protein